jgi:hypothetical protein
MIAISDGGSVFMHLKFEEASYLMNLLQNPFTKEKDESNRDEDMRLSLWRTMHDAGVSVL